jgi:drug/metabolite transporter (DMT)-like permease
VINTQTLAIIASLIHISAFVIYNKDIFRGKCHPSPISWFLWAFITVLNFTSYKVMNNDWIVAMLPIVGSAMCIFTFAFLIFSSLRLKRKIQKPDRKDIAVLLIGAVAIVVWQIFKSATYANLIVQGCFAFSTIPTIRSVWRKPRNEKPLPWFIWTGAFLVGLGIVLLKWQGNYLALVYPINAAACHLAVAILALRKKPNES